MLFIHARYITFRVVFADDVKVRPEKAPLELQRSAAVMAKCLASLLRYRVKHTNSLEKEKIVKAYLEEKGWTIEFVAV